MIERHETVCRERYERNAARHRTMLEAGLALVGLFWSLRLLIERRHLDHGVSARRFRTGAMMLEIDRKVATR